MAKGRVTGTYEEVYKREFFTPGSDSYGNVKRLEEKIAKADALGLLDKPYVLHENPYSKAAEKERANRPAKKQSPSWAVMYAVMIVSLLIMSFMTVLGIAGVFAVGVLVIVSSVILLLNG